MPRWLPPLPLPRNIKLQWIIRLIEHDVECHSCINFVLNDHDFQYYVNHCRGNYNYNCYYNYNYDYDYDYDYNYDFNYNYNYNYNNYAGTTDNN